MKKNQPRNNKHSQSFEFSNKEKAIRHLKISIENNPHHLPSILSLCDILSDDGKHETCEKILNDVVAQNHKSHELFYCLAKVLFKQKKYKRALAYVDEGIALNSKFSKLYKLGSEILHRNKNHEQAIPYLENLIELDPLDGSAYFELANLVSPETDFDKKKLLLEIAIELMPVFEPAANKLAHLYINKSYDLESTKEERNASLIIAERLLKKVIKTKTMFGDPWYQIAKINLQKMQINQAEKYFKKAINFKDTAVKSTYQLALIQQNKKKFAEALVLFKKSIKGKYRQSECQLKIALILMNEKKFFDSIKFLKQAIENVVNEQEKYYAKSKEYSKQSNFNLARKNLKQALNHKKIHAKILFYYYKCKNYLNHHSQIDHFLHNALELDPTNSEIHYELGLLSLSKNNLCEAKKCFLNACNMNWNHVDSHLQLGAIFKKLGDKEKSTMHLKIVIDLDSTNQKAAIILNN